MDELKVLAQQTYETICGCLDSIGYRYSRDPENLAVYCDVQGDDLPVGLSLRADPERGLVMLLSKMPFAIGEDKRLDAAIAVSAVNDRLVAGCFDYDLMSGELYFRMSSSFIDCRLSENVIGYMLYLGCQIADAYNDQFLMLSKGLMSLEQFLNKAAE